MTKAVLALALAAGAALGAGGAAPDTSRVGESPIKRTTVAALEKKMDGYLRHAGNDSMDVMGNTRGIYLHDYGAVFTTLVNLIVSPGISPFRQSMSQQEIVQVHNRKIQQLPVLRQAMREMLLHSAQALDSVPVREQVVVGVSLFYFSWEDTTGLPAQVVMRAERGKLLQKTGADGAIQTEEF